MDGFIPIDGDLHILESKAAFIAMATSAIGMLSEADFDAIQSRKAWEGLGWYSEELERDLHNLYQQMMENSAQPQATDKSPQG